MPEQKNKEKYLEDMQIIKDILLRQEKRPIIEPWVFNSWTVLIIISSIIQFIINFKGTHHYDSLILWIWIPTILLGGTLETIGWLRNTEKEGLLIKSRTNISLLHLFLIMVAASLLLYAIIRKAGIEDYFPVIMLMWTGVFFTIFIFFTHSRLYIISELFVGLAIVYFIFNFQGPVTDLSVGIITGICFFICGLVYRKYTNQENK